MEEEAIFRCCSLHKQSMDFELSAHTKDVLNERNIPEEWVWLTLDNPDGEKAGEDNNIHYFRSIAEHAGRILHVVVNPHVLPKKVVTKGSSYSVF